MDPEPPPINKVNSCETVGLALSALPSAPARPPLVHERSDFPSGEVGPRLRRPFWRLISARSAAVVRAVIGGCPLGWGVVAPGDPDKCRAAGQHLVRISLLKHRSDRVF